MGRRRGRVDASKHVAAQEAALQVTSAIPESHTSCTIGSAQALAPHQPHLRALSPDLQLAVRGLSTCTYETRSGVAAAEAAGAVPVTAGETGAPGSSPSVGAAAAAAAVPPPASLAASRAEEECAVCLSDFEQGDLLRQLRCGHRFHCACIDEWLIGKGRAHAATRGAHVPACPLSVQGASAHRGRVGGERPRPGGAAPDPAMNVYRLYVYMFFVYIRASGPTV